jgi:hypothetical protein
MGLQRRALHLTAVLLTAATMGLTAPASAQDDAKGTPALARRSDFTLACAVRDGLSLCVDSRSRAQRRRARILRDSESAEEAGKMGRLTRLAGMFMGRVDAAEVGDFRFRFILDLR